MPPFNPNSAASRRDYYGVANPKWTTVAMAPPPRKRPPRMSIDKWAQIQAQKYIDEQIKGIELQRNIFLDELRKQSELEAQRGLALAQALQSMNFGGKIQGIYGQAAGDIAGLAGGFSEGMQDVVGQQAAEMSNMVSGTGQEGATRNEGVGMGDVLYGTQGYIPGRSLSETGAAFGMQAALEPSFAARIGQLEAGRTHAEGLKGLDQFTQALIEARSGKGDLVQQFREMRMEAKNDAWKQRFEMLKWQADQHYRNYMLALERGDKKLAMREYQLAVRKQKQAELEAAREFQLDTRRENRLGREATKSAKGGGLTPTQKKNAVKEVTALDLADDIRAAIANGEWYVGSGPPKPGARQALHNKLFNKYKHLAMGNPAAKKRLHMTINQALDAAAKGGAGAAPSGGSGGSSGYGDYR